MVPSYATVKRWAVEFKRGRQSFEDDANPERLVTIAFSEMVNNVNSIDELQRDISSVHLGFHRKEYSPFLWKFLAQST